MCARPRLGPERLNEVVQAAMAVFARAGFQQARMEDVAQEAGLAKGTLYLYFKSKDDLIAAILHRLFSGELRALQELEEVDAPARERVLMVTRRMAAEMQRLSILLPIWFEFYAIAARHKGVRQFLKGYFADYRVRLAALIQQGVERGEFRAVDPAQAATTLIALYEGLALLWALDPQAMTVETLPEAAVRLLLDGLSIRTQEEGEGHA